MSDEANAVRPKRRRPQVRTVQVKSVTQVTPRMRRVVFAGDALAGFGPPLPAAHMKLFFLKPGEVFPNLSDGPPPPEQRPTSRTYTPLRFDPDTLKLDVEFVLHGDGPASTWAAQAEVGQPMMIAGPGRGYEVDPNADWFLIVVDETAIPAAATILTALPKGARATVIAEVADAAEIREFPSPVPVDWLWLTRDGRPAGDPDALVAAVHAFDAPAGSGRAYAGCEAAVVRAVRGALLERGMASTDIVARGYWKRGDSNHPDGDYITD